MLTINNLSIKDHFQDRKDTKCWLSTYTQSSRRKIKWFSSYFIFRPLTPPYVPFGIRRFVKIMLAVFLLNLCKYDKNSHIPVC
jgi:hypothetical protein